MAIYGYLKKKGKVSYTRTSRSFEVSKTKVSTDRREFMSQFGKLIRGNFKSITFK